MTCFRALTSAAAIAASLAGPLHAAELIGFYEFEGNYDDSSPAGNNPTSVDPDVALGPGYNGGQAASFNGGTSEIGINVPIDINVSVRPNLTIGAWINQSGAAAHSAPWGHDDGGWDRGLDTTADGASWAVSNSEFFSSGIPVTNDWSFVTVTYRGGSAALNVDGQHFNVPSAFTGPSARTDLAIGSLNPASPIHVFNGLIDNLFVYDDTLSAKQIEQIRAAGPGAIQNTLTENLGPRTTEQVWNFEAGDLTGWATVDTLIGDNQVFTSGGQPADIGSSDAGFDYSSVEGDYFVRTWDGTNGSLGDLSDAHTGIIETDPFVLGPNANFEFLIGGGRHPFAGDPDSPPADVTSLNLEREVGPGDWEMIFSSTGPNANVLSEGFWDAGLYEGDTVRLRIYDTHQGGWGHIDVDNIRYTTAVPEPSLPALLVPASLLFVLVRRRRRK